MPNAQASWIGRASSVRELQNAFPVLVERQQQPVIHVPKAQIVTREQGAPNAIGNTLVIVIHRLGWNLTFLVIKMNALATIQIMNATVLMQIGWRAEVIIQSELKQPPRPLVVRFIIIIVCP